MKRFLVGFALVGMASANVFAACPDFSGDYSAEMESMKIDLSLKQYGCDILDSRTAVGGSETTEIIKADGTFRASGPESSLTEDHFTNSSMVATTVSAQPSASDAKKTEMTSYTWIMTKNDAGDIVGDSFTRNAAGNVSSPVVHVVFKKK